MLAALLAFLSLAGCSSASNPQGSEDICPGKLLGEKGVEPIRAAGLILVWAVLSAIGWFAFLRRRR